MLNVDLSFLSLAKKKVKTLKSHLTKFFFQKNFIFLEVLFQHKCNFKIKYKTYFVENQKFIK